jgi:outer membrane autotransporter protein
MLLVLDLAKIRASWHGSRRERPLGFRGVCDGQDLGNYGRLPACPFAIRIFHNNSCFLYYEYLEIILHVVVLIYPGRCGRLSYSIALPMKSNQVFNRAIFVSFLLSAWLIPQVAAGDGGTSLYWDILTGGPSGPWDLVRSNWSPNAAGGSPAPWVNGSNAVFSATELLPSGDFTVTLATNVVARDLTYTGGSLDSTLQIAVGGGDNTITMGNPEMLVTVDFGTTLNIAPTIAGSGALTLQSGILILTGANTYTGGTTISSGTLQLGSGGVAGSITGAVVNNDAFNIVHADTSEITTITNNTGSTTNFLNASTAASIVILNNGGFTNFMNSSGAAFANITNNGGFTQFFDTSTAGSATINDNSGGFTEFFDTSSAGLATISANSGGEEDFNNRSTAGLATLTINSGGKTQFFDSSTAGNATITVNSGGEADFNNTSMAGAATVTINSDGRLQFFDKSTAGTAAIAVAGELDFNNQSTAAAATLTVDTDGKAQFFGASTAGHATITNSGGQTLFNNTSSAGNASLNNGNDGFTEFFDTSTAGNSIITNTTSGSAGFAGMSTAGNSVINNGGLLIFLNGSTAGNATVTNNEGITEFGNTSTAGSATITTNNHGIVGFLDTTTAANSTLITNSGGETIFLDASTGGQARFITNAGGIVDISRLTSTGTTAGSIEGAGNYFLGSKAFTVGLNNLSTRVSGIIGDGAAEIVGISPLTTGAPLTAESLSTLGGSLIKVGTGTLTLTGPNTYTGGTTFNGGILAVNNDGNLGTGPLRFGGGTLETLAAGGGISSSKPITLNAGGGTFLADAGTTSSLSGAIGGLGSLTKDGPGALALTGTNLYQGGTILNAGVLTVNGAQALGLGNVAVNGGILRADPQPINVKGNYTQIAGGTLQLQVAGANPGQYDTLNVGGNAALGGTLQLVSLGFQPKVGNQLTLVTTGGKVSGRFAQFVDPFAAGPGFTIAGLVYGPNSVLLEFRTAASFALTSNQLAAANLVDAVHQDPRAANLISFLNQQPFANLPGDFERISPDELTAFYEISFSNANIQRLNLESRLDDLHHGSSGFSSNMKVNGGATVNLESRADADGKSSKAVVEPILQPGPENRWGVWTTGFGDFVSVDSDANANGYNFTTGGVSLGVDYRLTDQLAIGLMGEYSHTWTSLQPSGNIDVNSGRGGLYATWYHHGIYLNTAIYGGYNSYDSSRSGLRGLATGNTEGAEMSTFISGGYDFHFATLTVGPIAALQYTYANVNGFSEDGSLAPLQIQSDSADSLRSDVGFRIFYQWQIGKILVEPSLKAAWEHEYLYSALPVTASFAGIPGPSATSFGPSEGHDSAIISAGVSAQWTPAMTIYVNYDGQLGRGNYDSNAVTGGVRISF